MKHLLRFISVLAALAAFVAFIWYFPQLSGCLILIFIVAALLYFTWILTEP